MTKREQAVDKQQWNIDFYHTDQALEQFSFYNFLRAEKYLFPKYYKGGDNILDLACGAGRTTLRLYEMGLSVKGIDISTLLIGTAKKRFPYLDLEVGNYTQINVPDESYDHVLISWNGLDYAFPEENRLAAIRECFRTVKEGGTLIFSSHNIKSFHTSPYYLIGRHELMTKLRNSFTAFKESAYVYENNLYVFHASPAYVIRQTEQAGFTLAEMVGYRNSHNYLVNLLVSPHIHYVFVKRGRQL